MNAITTEQRDAAADAMARHVGWQGGSIDALDAVLAALGITVSDEPEAPDDVIERARATVERSMGRAWSDEGEYANLPQQAAHDLATAGLLRTEPDERAATAERIATKVAIRTAQMFEDAWDEGNAMGLYGWVGPGRGSVADQYAIDQRERTIDRLVDALRDRIAREAGEVGR